MNLGIISCVEVLSTDHMGMIDKICRHLWEMPSTVRFYSLVTESNECKDINAWADLYFGCKFIVDSSKKLPRVNSSGSLTMMGSVGDLMKLGRSSSSSSPRSNTPSPRLNGSPRINISPRKLSSCTVNNLQIMATACNHIIIIGSHDQLNLIVKSLGEARIIIVSNIWRNPTRPRGNWIERIVDYRCRCGYW